MAYSTWKSYKLKIPTRELFKYLSQKEGCFFLDSSFDVKSLGRYSFIGCQPFLKLTFKNKDPFPELREKFNEFKIKPSDAPVPFQGGAVGYLSYDLGFVLEKKAKKIKKAGVNIPDCVFNFYNTVAAIDHKKSLFYIFSSGFPEKKYSLAKSLAEDNLKKFEESIRGLNIRDREDQREKISAHGRFDKIDQSFPKHAYLEAVKRAKDYIRAGDIYQVNLSQMFEARTSLASAQIYRRLRKISPSSFGAYFDAGDHQIISSSPERFLCVEKDRVTTRPMKGTRSRGKNRLEDLDLRNQLIKSAKDRAELMMIVDLERNDLGRVCSYESIKVSRLRELETYNTVYQTTSSIEGALHSSKDRFDLLRAAFPGGSIIGCPKIRAMQIIEELEPHRRGIYTGALGYLSFSGNMDFNILIRSILNKNGTLHFGAGGGIVADSRPEAEYQEIMAKSKGILEAINGK